MAVLGKEVWGWPFLVCLAHGGHGSGFSDDLVLTL